MQFTREFQKFRQRVWDSNLGNPVPTRLKKEFGKKFNQKDMLILAKTKAKMQGVQIYKWLSNGSRGWLKDEQ